MSLFQMSLAAIRLNTSELRSSLENVLEWPYIDGHF
jgi:hypothetical protein